MARPQRPGLWQRMSSEPETITVRCFSAHRSRAKQKILDICFAAAAPHDHCVITHSPIAQVSPEFLPANTVLFTSHPELNKATIAQCNHSFHALSLLYHFIRNSMSCPVCRSGATDKVIRKTCFQENPVVRAMHHRARKLKREEDARVVEEETQLLIAGLAPTIEIVEDFYNELMSVAPNCSFFFFDTEEELQSLAAPAATFTCPMRLMDTRESVADEVHAVEVRQPPGPLQTPVQAGGH